MVHGINNNFRQKNPFFFAEGWRADRKHADYIDASSFIDFIENSRIVNTDFDVMLECKEKDIALFKLVR